MPDLQTVDDIAALAPQFDFGAMGLHAPAIRQWFGLWAIEPQFARQFADRMQGFNLADHARQVQVTQVAIGGDQAKAPIGALGRDRYQARILEGGIALIDISGSIMKYRASLTDSTSTVEVRQQIRAADASGDVSQILVRIDSPGGTVSGVADVFDDVRSASKPVTVYVEDLAASAGYWIAAGAQRIYANASSLIGSIGVFTVIADTSKSAEEMGVKLHLVTTGRFKGAFADGVPVTDEQIAYLQELIDQRFEQFMAAIETGRGLSRAQIKAIADGRVFTAEKALDLKLIDGVKTFDEVLAELRSGNGPRSGTQSRGGTAAHSSDAGSDDMTKPDATAPVAATLQELKAACNGAPSDFILAQLEAGATVAQAEKAWSAKQIADLQASNDALRKQADEAAKKPAAAAASGAAPVPEGHAPDDESAATGDPIAAWNAAVAAKVKAGMTKRDAIVTLASENKDLHNAYKAAYYERHGNATEAKMAMASRRR